MRTPVNVRLGTHIKRQPIEEPCKGKLLRTVLEERWVG